MKLSTMSKRILSFILTVVMLLGTISGIAPMVATATEQPETKAASADSLTLKAQELLSQAEQLATPGERNGLVDLTQHGDLIKGLRGRYYFRVTNGSSYDAIMDGSGDLTVVDGITRLYAPTGFTEGTYCLIPSGSTPISPANAITLIPNEYTDGGKACYLLCLNNNKVLTYGSEYSRTAASVATNPRANANDVSQNRIWLYHNQGDNFMVAHRSISGQDPKEYLLEYNTTTETIIWSNYFPKNNSSAYEKEPDNSHKIYLYRLWSTDALKDAIDTMVAGGYLNDPSLYTDGTYADFLSCLEESIRMYNAYNGTLTAPIPYGEYPQEKMDRQTNELLSYDTLLGSANDYIDIPVEFLDFRADGALMQNMGFFHLRYDGSDYTNAKNNTSNYTQYTDIGDHYLGLPELPGVVIPKTGTTIDVKSSNAVRTGLTLQTLKDGKLLYDPQTIGYIAYVLKAQKLGTTHNEVLSPNRDVYNKVHKKGFELGTWDRTLEKIGENGNPLLWSQVETAYDLAYYLTYHFWIPVEEVEGNLLSDGYYYNKTVAERDTLRLYMDNTGMYTLDAGKSMGYSGRYVLNAAGTQTKKEHPMFAPVDGLGFEADGVIADNVDTGREGTELRVAGYDTDDSNYLFTTHAYGSFIYYESQNQEFSFTGDDDVYFFINSQMALDIGGGHNPMSGSVKLNDIAETLGIEDGDLCSFDMFHAERATSGSNLKFTTNIKIADASAFTTKGQYLEQSGGVSYIESDIGMGADIIDNGLVPIGSTVAYGFDILNTGDVPLYNVSFEDKRLGTNISKDGITLYESALTNGAVTNITDIKVIYRTYDAERGELYRGDPQKLSYADLKNMVSQAVQLADGGEYGSLEPGYYWAPVGSEQQLIAFLTIGIPKNCQFTVYGFKRNTGMNDVPYTNTVISNCYYGRDGKDNLITGSASRILRVPDASQPPAVEKQELVLDYGKSLIIPLDSIPERVWFEYGSDAKAGELLGFVTEGYNGQLLKKIPTNLYCVTSDDPAAGKQGIFTRSGDNLIYTMTEFMEQIENIYAVVEIENFINGGTVYSCVLAQISLIPANMMYYEAEDFADTELDYTQAGGSFTNLTLKQDGSQGQNYQDFDPAGYRTYNMVIDRDSIPAEAFFADFDGMGYAERYRDQPQYNKKNYDIVSNWDKSTGVSSLSVDNVRGTLTAILNPSSTAKDWGLRTKFADFRGAVSENYFEVRLRIEDVTLTGKQSLKVTLDGTSNTYKVGEVSLSSEATDRLNAGEYITISGDASRLKDDIVQNIYVFLSSEGCTYGTSPKLIFDYIYFGPKTGMKQETYGNYLYFTFDGTTADDIRYGAAAYGGEDYDNAGTWSTDVDSTISSVGNGYLVFKDKNASTASEFVHAGSTTSAKGISYTCSGDDICRVRMKIDNGTRMVSNGSPMNTLVRMEFIKSGATSAGTIAGRCYFDLETVNNNGFQVFDIPLTTADYLALTELTSVRISTYGISGATYTIDYIYVGPEALANKATGEADYLFFDFTDSDSAKLRYSNSIYGSRNYDVGSWHHNSAVSGEPLFKDGTMSFTTTANIPADRDIHTVITSSNASYTGGHPLSYTPSGSDYFKIRMKIDGATDTEAGFRLYFAKDNDTSSTHTAYSAAIPNGLINNGYFIIEGNANFGSAGVVTAIRPEVFNMYVEDPTNNKVTFTFDYIYVGPKEKVNVTTQSLYFGFENTEEDQLRYNYHTYGGYNYDVFDPIHLSNNLGHWATSPQLNENNAHDLTIDNEMGIMRIRVTDKLAVDEEGNEVGVTGPYLITTNTFNAYSLSAERASLHYRPEDAQIVQIRFRVKDCAVSPNGKTNIVFVFGGYDRNGTFVDHNSLPIMRGYYTVSEGYQVVSIRVNEEFRKLAEVTNLGLRFQNIQSDGSGVVEIDYIYVGTGDGAPYTYGYDSSYDTSSLYSNGTSLYTEGNGVRTDAVPNPAKYTETRFSFTGTGFDIISRTDEYQGTIRVEIYSDASYSKDSRVVGTSVNLKGELELYQIPVYSKHGLEHGTYYVSVMVNDKVESIYEFLNRGNQFFLDAIRIYDPIDVSKGTASPVGSDSAIAYSAYCADGEAHPKIQEIRDILLSAEDFDALTGTVDGAVFVDYSTVEKVITPTESDGSGGNDITDSDLLDGSGNSKVQNHITSDIVTYRKIGPNNETYLGPQQLIAYELRVYSTELPDRVDIGAKAITTMAPELAVRVWNNSNKVARTVTTRIQGPSHQYYSLNLEDDLFTKATESDGTVYYQTIIQIINKTAKTTANAEQVLSITDVKVAYAQKPTITKTYTLRKAEVELPTDDFEYVRFVVSNDLSQLVEESLKDLYNYCDGHIPGNWNTVSNPGVDRDGYAELRCSLCGAVLEVKTLPAVPQLTFAGASVSLYSNLAINYKVDGSFFTEQGFSDPYVVVIDNGKETIIRDFEIANGQYTFVYRDIAPHRIGDTVTATLYAIYNGATYSSDGKNYSVADYCYNVLDKIEGNDSFATLRTLLVDLLHYGTQTQRYMHYREDALINSRLTEKQLAWGSQLSRALVSHRNGVYETIADPTVEWLGAGLNLQDSVAVRFKIGAESYDGLEVKITLAGKHYIIKEEDFDYRADGTYIHFTSLNAAQMSEPIYMAVYRDGVQVSNTVCYSVESYACSKQNDTAIPHLAELVKRMMCYGDSAKAYIGK